MDPAIRRTMVYAMDKKLRKLKPLAKGILPPKGWVRAVRTTLGMTAEQLAKRLGAKTPRVFEIERGEITGSVTIRAMQRAARAMDCEFVWAIVPKQASSLEQIRHTRARQLAEKQLARVNHTMALENQLPVDRTHTARRAELTLRLLANDRKLWSDDGS